MHFEADAYDMPGPFEIGVLAVRSAIDSTNVPKFECALDAVLERHRHAILDLTATSYVSSIGWGTLLGRVPRDRGRIRIAGMSAAVHDVFDLLGLSVVLASSPTVGEAVAAIVAEASNEPSCSGPAHHAA